MKAVYSILFDFQCFQEDLPTCSRRMRSMTSGFMRELVSDCMPEAVLFRPESYALRTASIKLPSSSGVLQPMSIDLHHDQTYLLIVQESPAADVVLSHIMIRPKYCSTTKSCS